MSTSSINTSSPSNVHSDIAASKAHDSADKAKSAMKQGGEAAVDAADAVKHEAESIGGKSKKAVGQGVDGAKKTFKSGQANAISFKNQITSAYNAGATSSYYDRNASTPLTTADKIRIPFKAAFTAPSYVAGHTIHNPAHGVRETRFTLNGTAKTFAGAAAVWLSTLTLAGISPKHLGFLVKPIPHAAGFSLVNLAAYVGLAAIGVAAVLIAIRVAVALYAKYQESKNAPNSVATGSTEASESVASTSAAATEEAKAA